MRENNPFADGDSSENSFAERMDKFFQNLEEIKACKKSWTLIIDDPLDNSFIQNPYHPQDDPNVVRLFFSIQAQVVEIYDRTYEQNEEFGLNDIKTENYQDVKEKA